MKVTEITKPLEVAGVTYENRQEIIRRMSLGTGRLELVPEPTNQYDPDAIKVVHKGKAIGYIPRGMSTILSLFFQHNRKLFAFLNSVPTRHGIQVPIITVYEEEEEEEEIKKAEKQNKPSTRIKPKDWGL